MKFAILLVLLINAYTSSSQVIRKIYVLNNTGVNNKRLFVNGDVVYSIAAACKLVDIYIEKKVDTVCVLFAGGTYYLQSSIQINNSFNSKTVIVFEPISKHPVVISGGYELPKLWKLAKKSSKGCIWQIQLADTIFSKWNVNTLFCNGKWLNNASSDTFVTNGPLPEFNKRVAYYDFTQLKKNYKDSLAVFCCFKYFPNGQINKIEDWDNVKLLQVNSWETSWHDILSNDTARSHIYLSSPSCYPVGFFPGNNRFVISNSVHFFRKNQQWYFDVAKSTLFFRCNNSDNPNKMQFCVPRLRHLVILEGNKNHSVKNIFFRNIQFVHAASNWGIHETSPDAELSNVPKSFKLKETSGFSSLQNSIACGESVLLKFASDCQFVNCSFSNSENYGIRIGENCVNNVINQCTFNNLGGGGVIVGFDNYSISTLFRKQAAVTPNPSTNNRIFYNSANCPSRNSVTNCIIDNCGKIHKGTVGIGLMHANNTQIIGNCIKNLPYSGIAVGWWYFEHMQSSKGNTIAYNYISNVMQLLADGGGIYTIGPQFGSKYQNNYIENIKQSNHAIGANNNAFFFDVKSEGFSVDSNYTQYIQAQSIRFNECDSAKIVLGINSFNNNGNSPKWSSEIKSNIKRKNKFL